MFKFTEHVADWPMKGTEAQARWARSLRFNRAEELQRLNIKGIALQIRSAATEEEMIRIHCYEMEQAKQLVMAVAINVLASPEASWWINNRNTPAANLIVDSYRAVLQQYSRESPFPTPHD